MNTGSLLSIFNNSIIFLYSKTFYLVFQYESKTNLCKPIFYGFPSQARLQGRQQKLPKNKELLEGKKLVIRTGIGNHPKPVVIIAF